MVSSIEGMLALQTAPAGGWVTPVLKTEATRGVGVAELLDALDRFRAASPSVVATRRTARSRFQLHDQLIGVFLDRVASLVPAAELDAAAERIAARAIDPRTAAAEILSRVWAPGEE
jgi:LAO/AO transport system kinase